MNSSASVPAGQHRLEPAGNLVTLAGMVADPDGDPVTHSWIWSGGTGRIVALFGAYTLTVAFVRGAEFQSFALRPGTGYIISVPTSRVVTFTGYPWNGQ